MSSSICISATSGHMHILCVITSWSFFFYVCIYIRSLLSSEASHPPSKLLTNNTRPLAYLYISTLLLFFFLHSVWPKKDRFDERTKEKKRREEKKPENKDLTARTPMQYDRFCWTGTIEAVVCVRVYDTIFQLQYYK